MFDASFPYPIVGGKEKQALVLSKELITSGNTLQVLSFKTIPSHLNESIVEGIKVFRLNKSLMSLINIPKFIFNNKSDIDIIHIHTPSWIGIYTLIVSKLIGKKIVFKFPNEELSITRKSLLGKLKLFLVAYADLLVTLEEKTFVFLKRKMKNDSKIKMMRNGIVIPQFAKIEFTNPLTGIFVGRLVSQKGVELLIESVKYLKDQGIILNITIIGEGPLKDKLIKYVKNIQIENQINFVGFQDPNLFYTNHSFMILPSYKEGMSNVILESISYGLPVICSNVGASKDLLGDYYEKFTFIPGNVEDLKNKILQFINMSTHDKMAYSSYLRRRAEKEFSIKRIAEQYIAEYKMILN
jgi:glycosyltransferase involved in cell wall biosynthesis